MENLSRENIEFLIVIGGAIITIMGIIISIIQYFHREQVKRLKEDNNRAYKKLSPQEQKEIEDKKIVQEEKVVYVKYLYIRKKSDPPVYKKYLKRAGKYIDVRSEYHYYRYNKFNTKNNAVSIRDSTSGAVSLNIVHPWQDLFFADKNGKNKIGIIEQDLSNSDTYFTVSTYYNGFNEGEDESDDSNEDIAMKMEADTLSARLIADFSSIVGLDKLFVKPPDVYLIKRGKPRIKIHGLEEINEGIYHIHKTDLKKGDVIFLDFHVNWDFLNK